MATEELKAELEAGEGERPVKPRRRRLPKLRRRNRKMLEVTHRWLSIVLGIALLAITTSGAVLLYLPEIEKATSPSLYETTGGPPISATRALAIADRDPSGIEAEGASLRDGLWVISGDLAGHPGHERQLHLDAATGKRLGLGDQSFDVLGWLANFHDCGLGCEGYAGYTPFLAKTVVILGNEELTWGGLLVGLTGVILLWLVLSGLWLWWPTIKRFARGFAVRRKRGTYAFNYDLHKVVGIAALPFLAMWAFTGAGFEFKQFEDAWYAVLPGKKPPEYAPPASTPMKDKEAISVAAAQRAAQRRLPDAVVRSIYLPVKGEKTSTYEVQLSKGFDPRKHSVYQGNVDVAVDQYSAKTSVAFPTGYSESRPLAQTVWQDWQFAGHAGTPVNGWWRTVWLAFGIAPLVLAVTGMVTWWIRRRKRRRRNRMRAAAAVPA